MKDISIYNNRLQPTSIGKPVPNPSKLPENKESFGKMLQTAFEKVNQLQTDTDQGIQKVAAGNQADIHQTMIAMEKADVSFKLMMEVRNKVVAAYETISRMQI